jgi:ribonuclease E
MTTDNNRNYDPEENNFTQDNQSYVDQYQKEHVSEGNELEEEQPLNEDENLDTEFSNAIERDDQEDLEQNDENDLEDDDLEENDLDDDLVEDYDENDTEPETFADDGYKID